MTKLELKSSHEVIYTVDVTDVDSIFYCKPTDPDILTVRMKDGKRLYCDEVCPLQEEPVSEDLEKAAEKAAVETFFVSPKWTEIRKELFKAGANWQKEQDQSIIELAEDHAMLAGMEKMKEQMMKEAVEAKVIPADLDETQFCLSDYDEVSYITAMVKAGKLKLLDKVKLIIFKED